MAAPPEIMHTFQKWALSTRQTPIWIRYSTTTLIVLGALWAQMALEHLLPGPDIGQFLLFFPAIVACSLLFNRGNGVYATALSAVVAIYFLLPPKETFLVSSNEVALAVAIFVAAGLLIAFAVEALHMALTQLAVAHAEANALAEERHLLLLELAHRTRNDLANVITILQLQARATDDTARQALNAAADRLRVVAGLHRRLEFRDKRVVVDSAEYLGGLCSDLRLSLLAMRPIALEAEIESHAIILETAVPLGLIINEMITNAVKHAFDDDQQGLVEVRFAKQGRTDYRLSISDNGRGMPSTQNKGLGKRLTQMLASQLGGTITITAQSPGTLVTVSIPANSAASEAEAQPSP